MMKILVACVLSLAVLGGCCNTPQEVKSSLYTAEIAGRQTLNDAEAPAVGSVWDIPATATPEEVIAKKDAQIVILKETISEMVKNTQTTIRWFRTGSLVPTSSE